MQKGVLKVYLSRHLFVWICKILNNVDLKGNLQVTRIKVLHYLSEFSKHKIRNYIRTCITCYSVYIIMLFPLIYEEYPHLKILENLRHTLTFRRMEWHKIERLALISYNSFQLHIFLMHS